MALHGTTWHLFSLHVHSPYSPAIFVLQTIGCTSETRVELTFYCQGLGLQVEEDEEENVVVAGWDEGSPAAESPSLMVRQLDPTPGPIYLSIDWLTDWLVVALNTEYYTTSATSVVATT